jgi:ADP-heptose:LPS heptosyltransferase
VAVTAPPRLVVLRALGLGDLLTAVPALRAIADAFPCEHRVLVGPPPLAPLMPLFANVAGHGPQHWRTADVGGGVDIAINLHGRGPESTRALEALHPQRLIAFGSTSTWRQREHEVHRWCRLLEEHGIPADPSRLDAAEIHSAGLSVRQRVTETCRMAVVHAGAASASRRWPADRWAGVACGLRERGFDVVLTGSRGEVALAGEVARAARLPPAAVLAGRTDVVALAGLVAGAAVLTSGDTGIAHLATALGTPSVVLFGPVSPSEWGPPPDRPQHRALWHAADGYRGDPHGASLDPALDAVTVDDVLQAVDSVVSSHACR